MAIPKFNYLSAAQYIALEEQAETRNEYYRGELFMLACITAKHNTIKQNCVIALRKRLKGKGYSVYDENVRLEVEKEEHYTYPDVMVTCHPEYSRERTTMHHRSVVIEVLADSTESNDRELKFHPYRKLSSLQHYMLISQNRCLVECFTRAEDNTWTFAAFDTLQALLPLPALALIIPLEELYDEVAFEPLSLPA